MIEFRLIALKYSAIGVDFSSWENLKIVGMRFSRLQHQLFWQTRKWKCRSFWAM